MKSLATLFFCLLTSLAVNAAAIGTGNTLPEVAVAEKGELVMNGDQFTWQPWSTTKVSGQVQIIQHLAARLSASKINEPFTDALKVRDFPKDKHVSITILNMDDALWGSSAFITSELKSNKKKYPFAVMVADTKGDGLKTWSLKKESSAIIILDKQGKVAFFKDGALTPDEIKSTLQLIESLL